MSLTDNTVDEHDAWLHLNKNVETALKKARENTKYADSEDISIDEEAKAIIDVSVRKTTQTNTLAIDWDDETLILFVNMAIKNFEGTLKNPEKKKRHEFLMRVLLQLYRKVGENGDIYLSIIEQTVDKFEIFGPVQPSERLLIFYIKWHVVDIYVPD